MMAINRVNALGMQYRITEVFGSKEQCQIRTGSKHIIVDHSIHTISSAWYRWQQQGMYIQDAFSFLTPDEREFILTGITKEEWDETFKEEE